MKRALGSGVVVALALAAAPALAAKVPIAFAPTLGANPQRTQQKLATLASRLPASFQLPATLTTLTSGQITLSFLPESAAALSRAQTSAKAPPMTWPGGTPVLCAKHAAFSVPPSLLAQGAAQACAAADASVRQELAAVATCRDVEQPERYVLATPPAKVDDAATASIESLIGLAGEALSHYPNPQDGLLPKSWVETLRGVVWKIRQPAVLAQIATARASYKDALGILAAQSTCFEAATRSALVQAIGELDQELAGAAAHVDALAAAGKAQADQELVCLSARGRTRGALPFPSLTAAERKFVAFWLGGVYWRMRGGGLIPTGSTQTARTQFCERPLRRIGDLAGGAVGEEAGYRVFLNIFGGWGEWMDMGTTPGGQDLYEDLVDMTNRGRQQVQDPATASAIPIPIPVSGLEGAVPFLEAKGYDTTALLTGGLDMGACYAFAHDPLVDFRYADQPVAPYGGTLLEYFTAVGELCTGASISLGLAETLLDGTKTDAPPTNLCAGKQCGGDGCGGSCGTCAAGLSCEGGACVACTPSCEGKTCGDDGCGGSCGACSGAMTTRPDAGDAATAEGDFGRGRGSCGCRVSGVAEPMSVATAALGAIGLALARSARRRRRR